MRVAIQFFKDKYRSYSSLPARKRMAINVAIALLFLFCAFLSGKTTLKMVRASALRCVIYAFSSPALILKTLALFIFFLIFIIILTGERSVVNPVESTDNRGVDFLKYGTMGTGNFMSYEEAQEAFTICDIKDTKELILGQFSEGGKEVVAFKDLPNGGNRNVFILGSPGTGTSLGCVSTRPIEAILRGESVVITDPAKELYTSLRKYAESKGHKVKVFNIVDPEYSDAWDCISECLNPNTGRIDSLRLQEFCDIFLQNTLAPGQKMDFWDTASLNLLRAIIGWVAWAHEKDIFQIYNQYINEIEEEYKIDTSEYKTILERDGQDDISLIYLKNAFITYAKKAEMEQDVIDALCEAAEEAAIPFNISRVYDRMLNFGTVEVENNNFVKLPPSHPGSIAFRTFNRPGVSDNVKASSLQGLLIKMGLFRPDSIRRITSNKDIDLSSFGETPTVCFLITPDNNGAMKPLQSLFFSFLIKDLSEAHDAAQAKAEFMNTVNPRIPVNILMDEAASNGVIRNFRDAMANTRKRKLYITIIWQTIGQVMNMYGKNVADTIKSCCDILIFLGTADLDTAKYISEFMGVATVRSQSHKEPALNPLMPDSALEVTYKESQRPVMLSSEVMAVRNEIIVIRRGFNHVLRINRFGYIEHPAYINNELIKSNIFNYPNSKNRYTLIPLTANTVIKDKDANILPESHAMDLVGVIHSYETTNEFEKNETVFTEQRAETKIVQASKYVLMDEDEEKTKEEAVQDIYTVVFSDESSDIIQTNTNK